MNQENNYIEREWKTRILIDSSPRGNIIMYYDVYKQGFAYYSDQNSIPYCILNAVAMKYVLMFKCRDFYMNTNCLPKDFVSPLAKIFHDDDKKTNDVTDIESNDKTNKSIDISKGPFAKLKNYRLEEKKEQKIYYNALFHGNHSFVSLGLIAGFNLFRWSVISFKRAYYFLFVKPPILAIAEFKTEPTDKTVAKKRYVNKFINLGKAYNFNILQKITLNTTTNPATKFDSFFLNAGSRNNISTSKTIVGTVKSSKMTNSAISKNPNSYISWSDYKSKMNEGTNII